MLKDGGKDEKVDKRRMSKDEKKEIEPIFTEGL